MRFTTNTKPFSDALSLGIINANVSNYHKKSNIAQISATNDTLKINLEASNIKTEIRLKGTGEGERASIFVSSLLIKQLVATLESATVTLEFAENGLILHSGTSSFTLPKVIEANELDLDAPAVPAQAAETITIDKSDWKFIKENQMYAIAMSFVHPVYTRVWIGANGDVLVGDYDSSLFTHSKHSKLGSQCLLSDTIINLFISLPDGAKLTKLGREYLVTCSADSFEYVTQFKPLYEADEGIGDYNSDIFLTLLTEPASTITVSATNLSKFLGQADLLSSTTEDTIQLIKSGNTLELKDKHVDCKVNVTGNTQDFSLEFWTANLKKVISNYGDESIRIAPLTADGEVTGIGIWTSELATCIAAKE